MKKFWIVTREDAETTKVTQHNRFSNLADARGEAEKKTRQYGRSYVLLEAVWVCQTARPPIEWERVTEEEPV